MKTRILLIIVFIKLLLIYHTHSQTGLQNVYFGQSWYTIDQQSYKCLKFYNIASKQIIWAVTPYTGNQAASKTIMKSNQFNGHKNSVMYMFNISSVRFDFQKNIDVYFNESIVDTLWLYPNQNITYNSCDVAKTVMYECIKRNRKCGFFFDENLFQQRMNYEKCPQMSKFPLMYNGLPQKFKPFNGWNQFEYALGKQSSICQIPNSMHKLYSKNETFIQQLNKNQQLIRVQS